LVCDAGRVASRFSLNEVDTQTLGPDAQLLDRACSERISGTKHDGATLTLETMGKFGD
jgi:hypothetical protein